MRSVSVVAGLVLVCACSREESAQTDPNLRTRLDGLPSGDGKSCFFSGIEFASGISQDTREFAVGDATKAPDRCNDCTCTAAGMSCTSNHLGATGCTSPIQIPCVVAGVEHAPGPNGFQCADGSNTCWCRADGTMTQTRASPNPRCFPAEAPAGASCKASTVYAAPDGARCCRYASPCNVPTGSVEYSTVEECPPPAPPDLVVSSDWQSP